MRFMYVQKGLKKSIMKRHHRLLVGQMPTITHFVKEACRLVKVVVIKPCIFSRNNHGLKVRPQCKMSEYASMRIECALTASMHALQKVCTLLKRLNNEDAYKYYVTITYTTKSRNGE